MRRPILVKGTPVYYHNPKTGDTIPARVEKTEWSVFHSEQLIKIKGNFLEGDRITRVQYRNLTLQKDTLEKGEKLSTKRKTRSSK